MADSLTIPSLTSGSPVMGIGATATTTAVAGGAAVSGDGAGGGAGFTLSNPQVAAQVEEYLKANGYDIKFSVDDETRQTIVRIYNSASGELVRQIPDEEMVRLARALQEGLKQTMQASA